MPNYPGDPKCYESMSQSKIPPCDGGHCSLVQGDVNEICKAAGWPVGHPVLVTKDGKTCYCCCSCFAYGTPIEASAGVYQAIQEFDVGDEVLACGSDLKWESKTVRFSDGTGPNSKQPDMIYIEYNLSGESDNRNLIVTTDHLFLTPEGKLKRADKLVPGEGLVLADGTGAVPIITIFSGEYRGGVHHIATGIEKPTSLDGHLLNSNGVVSADYALQLFYSHKELEHELLVDDHEQMPVTLSDNNSNFAVSFKKEIKHFTPHANKKTINIPDNAKSFFTEEQAAAIAKKAKKLSPHNPAAISMTEYLFTVFKAFYPEVDFMLDTENYTPNSYSWEDNGQKFVVVAYGLVSLIDLKMEGVSLAIAHELGHLYGKKSTDAGGVSEANSDYYGAAVALRKIWWLDLYGKIIISAIKQMKKVFRYIPKSVDQAAQLKGYPSAGCRIEIYTAAAAVEGLPPCAKPEPIPLCTPEEADKIQVEVNYIGAKHGLKAGENVPVVLNGELRLCPYLPGVANSGDNMEIPDCTIDVCTAVQEEINRICKEMTWPRPVLIFKNQKLCYCYCV